MVTSPLAVLIPEVSAPILSVTLTPSSYASWTACFAANPLVTDFLLSPGNYEGWGPISAGLSDSGTALRKRVIRHVQRDVQPWLLHPSDEVRVQGFTFGTSSVNPTAYWVAQGLTMRAQNHENEAWFGSHDIVVDRCLIENGPTAYGFRITLWAYNISIQHCVIRNWAGAQSDSVGVQIKAPSAAQPPNTSDHMRGSRVTGCEIYNYVDAFAVTHDNNDDANQGIFGDTLVAYNHFYVTAAYQDRAENGLDLKDGSLSDLTPVHVYRNVVNGYRLAAGSDGVGIVCHNWCRNVLVEENVLWDLPMGTRIDNWQAPNPQVARGITYRKNLYYQIQKYVPADFGSAFQTRTPAVYDQNHFVDCVELRRNLAQLPGLDPITMTDNIAVRTSFGSGSADWSAGSGNSIVSPNDCGTREVTLYPLTNPTVVDFPDPTVPAVPFCPDPRKYTGPAILRLADLA